ncbi:MAG: 6-phosphofructokinase [Ruminococcaceae bacterium]|nr:6-phosphofructokinase [Oscillospiraceae bacterium]
MNIAVAQSGGPTVAINASLMGVFEQALKSVEIDKVYGSLNGIEGIINQNLVVLNDLVKGEEDIELIKTTPSTVLGSCRYKMPSPDDKPEVYEKIVECFKKHNIGAFFYIGGNDSMDTTDKLSKYTMQNGIDVKVIGIPKTIDNDLCYTDHTPGFGSAAKYLATTMQEIVRDSAVYDLKSVTVVEIMGRHAGWLTASSGVLHANGETAPHLIYLPESEFSAEKFLNDVRAQLEIRNSVIVAVSEGIKLDDASYRSGKVDNFGHEYLSGIGKLLENLITEKIGCKVRSIELNVMQRCSSHLSSKTDIEEATLIGSEGVKAALSGETGKMMTFERVSNNPYKIEIGMVDAKLVANAEKVFPCDWITDDGTNITHEAIQYFLPLINGEINIKTKNGMPVHFIIKK